MSETVDQELNSELHRIARVSDMLCTAHAGLRDRYARRAKFLDLSILLTSGWLLALAFVDPQINLQLTPSALAPTVWTGLLAFFVFSLSITQLLVDWKARASGHAVAFGGYSAIKREARELLNSKDGLSEQSCSALLSRYEAAGVVQIPEAEFLHQKKRHQLKVEISKHLDLHPGAWVWLAKIKFAWRDNFNSARDKR